MIAAVVLSSLVVVGGLVAACVYVVRVIKALTDRNHDTNDKFIRLSTDFRGLERERDNWKRAHADADAALTSKTAELLRERQARKNMELRLRDTLKALSEGGDPKTVVDAVNNELKSLAELGKR